MWELGIKTICRQVAQLAAQDTSSVDDVSFRRLTTQNRAAGSSLTLRVGHEVGLNGAYLAGVDGSMPGLGSVDLACC